MTDLSFRGAVVGMIIGIGVALAIVLGLPIRDTFVSGLVGAVCSFVGVQAGFRWRVLRARLPF